MARVLCTHMFDEGGCKREHCWYSHSKEDIEKVKTKYAHFSSEKRYLITEDTFGNQYFIPNIVIDKYLDRLCSRDIDFSKMTYEGYFDKKSKDDRNNRYRFVHLTAVTEIKQVSNSLRIHRPVSSKETSSPISFIERNSNNSDEIKELSNKIDEFKNFINENSMQNSIKFKESKGKTDELIKTVEKQKKEINDLKEIVEKHRLQIDDLEKNRLQIDNLEKIVKTNLEKTLKRTNPYDLRRRKRVKYNT